MKKHRDRLWNYLLDTIENQKEEINRLLQLSITVGAENKKLKEELEVYKKENERLKHIISLESSGSIPTPSAPYRTGVPNPYPIIS